MRLDRNTRIRLKERRIQLADFLLTIKSRAELSQNDIAKAAGVSRQSISQCVHGRGTLSVARIRTLAKEFNMDLNEYPLLQLEWTGDVPPDGGKHLRTWQTKEA